MPPRWSRLLSELPLFLGVAAGLVLYWWAGHAFVLDGDVSGYHWSDYLENAYMVVHGIDLGYARFRHPLHGALVGHLGEALWSYANAALLVSSVGAAALVVGSGLLGRVLAGPWAGGVAAFLVPTARVALTAGRWGNLYTALAGASLLTLALGAVTARRPRVGLALLAGLAGGLAWGLDARGLAMVPAAGALVVLGALRVPTGPWRRARQGALLAAFVLPLALGPVSKEALRVPGAGQPTLAMQIEVQRKVFLRWATTGHFDTPMPAACAGEDPTAPLHPRLLATDCAREMLRFNLSRPIPDHTLVPVVLLWLGLPLCLVPRRGEGLRDVADSAAALGLGAASLVALVLWMPFPDRYLLQFAPLFGLVPVVGVSRLVQRLFPARLAPWAAAAAALGVAGAAWQLDPTDRGAPTNVDNSREVQLIRQLTAQVSAVWQQGDTLLDCADLHTPARWLPYRTSTPPMMRLDDAFCLRWLAAPQGETRAWLILDETLPPRPPAGQDVDLPALLEAWTPVWTRRTVTLYRRDLGTAPP